MAGKKKNTTSITFDIISKSVASNTRIPIETCKAVLTGYSNFILNTIMLDSCPEDLTIQLKDVGKFIFKKKMGLKAGSTYKHPVEFGVCEKGQKVEMETVTVTEDRPDYLRLWFEVNPSIQNNLREKTENKWIKKNGKK